MLCVGGEATLPGLLLEVRDTTLCSRWLMGNRFPAAVTANNERDQSAFPHWLPDVEWMNWGQSSPFFDSFKSA